jgi:hypothetical protein
MYFQTRPYRRPSTLLTFVWLPSQCNESGTVVLNEPSDTLAHGHTSCPRFRHGSPGAPLEACVTNRVCFHFM